MFQRKKLQNQILNQLNIKKKSTNIILKKKKIEKLSGKTSQQSTVFKKKITKQKF